MYIVNLGEIRAPLIAFSGSSVSKESACNVGDLGSIPGSGRSPGERNDNALQYSCLENSMDRGAWWLQSMGSQRVRPNTFTFSSLFGWMAFKNSLWHVVDCTLSVLLKVKYQNYLEGLLKRRLLSHRLSFWFSGSGVGPENFCFSQGSRWGQLCCWPGNHTERTTTLHDHGSPSSSSSIFKFPKRAL